MKAAKIETILDISFLLLIANITIELFIVCVRQFPRVDRRGDGGGAAARVGGVRARGAGRGVRAAAAHARRARPAPGAAQQGQHAVHAQLPRRPAHHVGRPCCQYSITIELT